MSHQIVVPLITRCPPIIGVPYIVFATCCMAYGFGKLDEKQRKRRTDDFFLRSYPENDERIRSRIAWKREMAGGDKEFRPGFFDTISLSREARQELHAERKRGRERKRASNGSVRLGLVDATLLTASF